MLGAQGLSEGPSGSQCSETGPAKALKTKEQTNKKNQADVVALGRVGLRPGPRGVQVSGGLTGEGD